MIRKIDNKVIFYVISRGLVLILPIIGLIVLMEYTTIGRIEKGGYTDRGLGFAVLGGLWIIIFFCLIIIETIYKMYRKQKIDSVNLFVISVLVIVFFVVYIIVF